MVIKCNITTIYYQMRSLVRVTMKRIAGKLVEDEAKRLELLSSPAKVLNRDCYEEAVDHFNEHCFNLNKVCVIAILMLTYIIPLALF